MTIKTPPIPSAAFLAEEVDMAKLPGWDQDKIIDALPALMKSCEKFKSKVPETVIGEGEFARTAADWEYACAGIENVMDGEDLRDLLENAFTAYQIEGLDGNPSGKFTGYYEAEMKGAMFYSPYFPYPVYGKPIDLVSRKVPVETKDPKKPYVMRQVTGRLKSGKIEPYPTRAEIEKGGIENLAPILFWVDDAVDLHIAHIQGSSQIILPDGKRVRIGYAGNNGHKFKGLGRILLDAKLIDPNKASMPEVRDWLHFYPRQAERLMWENPRYIFFRMIDGEGPIGAMGVPLTPRRSLAVDTRVIPMGAPVWLSTIDPDGIAIDQLMVAQDIGSAIKGAVRGDFFWGSGDIAFSKAGRMNSPGQYFVMIPTVKTMPELLPHPELPPLPLAPTPPAKEDTKPDVAPETAPGSMPPETLG